MPDFPDAFRAPASVEAALPALADAAASLLVHKPDVCEPARVTHEGDPDVSRHFTPAARAVRTRALT